MGTSQVVDSSQNQYYNSTRENNHNLTQEVYYQVEHHKEPGQHDASVMLSPGSLLI